MRSLLRLLAQRADAVRRERPATRASGKRQRLEVTAAVPVAGVGCVVAVLLATGCATTSSAPVEVCNGHAALCQRPLDEVALAATHNSMSAPLEGWRSVQQDAPIAEQLHDGIRGLLIDTLGVAGSSPARPLDRKINPPKHFSLPAGGRQCEPNPWIRR